MSVADGLLNVTGKLKFPPSTTIYLQSLPLVHHRIFNSPIAVSVVAPTVPVVLVIATKSLVVILINSICRSRYYCSYSVAHC
jgi:hypothetical protein